MIPSAAEEVNRMWHASRWSRAILHTGVMHPSSNVGHHQPGPPLLIDQSASAALETRPEPPKRPRIPMWIRRSPWDIKAHYLHL
jgi:hypothetical protein